MGGSPVVYEVRAPLNYVAGTLSTAIAISDTSVSAAVFAGLPSTYSTGTYLPLVLHDPSAGTYEIVWVTAHSGSSTSVTVVRAREGSTARAWPSGTRVICAPTTRDVVSTSTLAGLPTDAHTGTRVSVTDKGYVSERVAGSWGPSVGVALADQVGPNRAGGNPSSGAAILARAGYVNLSTNGSGQVSVSYRVAFPTATLGVMITPAGGPGGGGVTFFSVVSETASGFVAEAWKVTDIAPYTTASMGSGFSCLFHYLAIGY